MDNIINLETLLNTELIKTLLLSLSVIIIFIVFMLGNRNNEKSIQKLNEAVAEIRKYSEIQNTYLSQFNDHFGVLDRKLKNLEEITSVTNRDISAMAEGITGEVGVGKAIELARQGATVEEILQNSNLKRDQAELIVKFHGNRV